MNIQKCAIVGCGAVGATAAYTLLGSGLFNELVLIDINQKKAEGEAMDIGHGVPFIHPVEIYAGTYEDLADAYLVIVTAGATALIELLQFAFLSSRSADVDDLILNFIGGMIGYLIYKWIE